MVKGVETNKIDIREDERIVVFKRPDRQGNPSKTYQMRISTPFSKGYFRSSTRMTKKNDAIQIALNKPDELSAKSQATPNLPLTGARFSKVLQEWSEYYHRQNAHLQKPENLKITLDRINLHIGTYFVKTKKDISIGEVKSFVVEDYIQQRREKGVSDNTIRRELTGLKMVLSFAKERKYLTDIPDFPMPSKVKKRRSTFSLEGYRTLFNTLRTYVSESSKHSRVYRNRFYLQQYILVMSNIGTRVGEMRMVRWGDIFTVKDGGKTKRAISIGEGKTGRRSAVLNDGTETYLYRLYDFREQESGSAPNKSNFVFCHKDGTPIGSFKKGFDAICKYADALYDNDGNKRTIYSLRHFYAHMRIRDQVSVYDLASQMGTSVKMIEDHYGPELDLYSGLRASSTLDKPQEPEIQKYGF